MKKLKVIKDWGVLVSQTGTEVVDISEKLGILPSLIVTNNITKISQKNMEIFGKHGVTIRTIPFRPTLEHYFIEELLEKKIITLHGFLRILPAGFFSNYKGEIFNGHPGLIVYHPELKGKDPQVRAWEGKYEVVGSVVHKVTEGVDEGEVVRFTVAVNTAESIEDMYNLLRSTSLETWMKFFTDNWNLVD
jgi:phosphoribosylglycinamide formyltransferase-1